MKMNFALPRVFISKRRVNAARTDSLSSSRQNLIDIELASAFINDLPTVICIINSDGKLINTNVEFRRCIDMKQDNSASNILEIISSEHVEKFYSTFMHLSQSKESEKLLTVENCLTKTKDKADGRFIGMFDWTLRKNLLFGDYFIIAGKRSSEASLADLAEKSRGKVNKMASFFRLSKDDEDISVPVVPSLQWEMFRNKVEVKTKKFLEIKQEQMKSQALAETLQTKRHFVRNVSHEIRTPLNIVMSGFTLLEEFRANFSESAEEILGDMETACTAAVDILNDLLTYEKLDSNILTLDKSLCNLSELAQSMVKMFQIQAIATNVRVTFEDESTEDSIPFSFLIDADPTKISQVIRNMVSNSLKFTPAGGDVTIKIRLFDELSKLRLEIYDTGPGIPLEERLKLFTGTIQFNPNELQSGQGKGLGFYLSRRIIDMHGGVIGVDTDRPTESLGSMFFIELPITERKKRTSLTPVSKRRSMAAVYTGEEARDFEAHKVKLLVVDDVPLCRKFHTKVLIPMSADCVEACNGQEAVDKMREALDSDAPFDGVIMDSSMPVMNGPPAAKLMREMGYSGKIYGITGNAFEADIADFKLHGADEVFIKPVQQEKFVYMMRTFMMFSSMM